MGLRKQKGSAPSYPHITTTTYPVGSNITKPHLHHLIPWWTLRVSSPKLHSSLRVYFFFFSFKALVWG